MAIRRWLPYKDSPSVHVASARRPQPSRAQRACVSILEALRVSAAPLRGLPPSATWKVCQSVSGAQPVIIIIESPSLLINHFVTCSASSRCLTAFDTRGRGFCATETATINKRIRRDSQMNSPTCATDARNGDGRRPAPTRSHSGRRQYGCDWTASVPRVPEVRERWA